MDRRKRGLDDVGDTYSLTIERHATKPQWRLRERRVIKGEVFESVTQWREFRLFSPELGMAQGRMRRFLFPQFGTGRLPQREIADK